MSLLRFRYYRNGLSLVGIILALLFGCVHLTLFLMDMLSPTPNPYTSIWLFVVLPPIVVAGFFLAIVGAWRQRRRERRQGTAPLPEPVRENIRAWRNFLLSIGVILFLLIPFVAITSYEGYNYTESVTFCGRTCHEPMKPSYTAYLHSPHARVACANCHIGEGASWFVRSKLSGLRQVFATFFDTYHRPIETPIKSLRPARETCERCHWPEMAFGDRMVNRVEYAADEENTLRTLVMELHTGGGDPELKPVSGIHWHVSPHNRVEYVAVDRERLDLPWVRVTTPEGVKIFRSDGLPSGAPPPEGELRVMDCIDCHNRPTHRFQPPDEALDRYFSLGLLDVSLPYLKREAVRLMAAPYTDQASANEAISQGLEKFYAENYPDVAAKKSASLKDSIQYVQRAFDLNIFPDMRTDWRVDPDHVGHKYSLGCFRCHEGSHKASDGSTIVKRCDACHDFLHQEEVKKGERALVRAEFKHPFPLEKAHKDLLCPLCHTGGPLPSAKATCTDCHVRTRDFRAGKVALLPDVTPAPDPMYGQLECIDCHDGPQNFAKDEIAPLCAGCHDEKKADQWIAELTAAREKAMAAVKALTGAAGAEEGARRKAAELGETLKALDRLGPVHDYPYALDILHRIEETTGAHAPPNR